MNMEEKRSFEEAMKALEGIVKDLESGTLSLEESVKKYDEGMRLAAFCHNELQKAEEVIVKMMNQGKLEDFSSQETE